MQWRKRRAGTQRWRARGVAWGASGVAWGGKMRSVMRFVAFAAFGFLTAGCTTNQTGPQRPITIEDDVAWTRVLAEPDLSTFYNADPITQAGVRNQIVTARMYIADMEYHYYEARLTKEMQEEGLLATAASLGLTTSATLIPVVQTKTLLSGIATGVTGLDKAYNEKELLSNTIQALQTQMRADRKTQAGVIFAKMFKDGGNNTKTITPIAEYTLPMALSDADAYYQAGTLSSALIGLSKTVANAETNADQAKSDSGPNPIAVSNVKATSAPQAGGSVVPSLRIANVARDTSYTSLRAQLFPNGAKTVEPGLKNYIESLFKPRVAVGVILTDARFATVRRNISACIVARQSGNPCPEGSLSPMVR